MAMDAQRFPSQVNSSANLAPGLRLRQARERLDLTFRDVERSSYQVASVLGRPDFIIPISRLVAIENHGVIPSPYRVYTLASIYGINPLDILDWYGIPVRHFFTDGAAFAAPRTHIAAPPRSMRTPLRFDPGFDPRRTDLLSRMVETWHDVEGALFGKNRSFLYGRVGLEDHMMEPLVLPGSLLLIDPTKRLVEVSGWSNDFERPVYFVDLRCEYCCSWCAQTSNILILQPHSLSPCKPRFFRIPDECEIVGQVIGSVRWFDGF